MTTKIGNAMDRGDVLNARSRLFFEMSVAMEAVPREARVIRESIRDSAWSATWIATWWATAAAVRAAVSAADRMDNR